MSIDPLVPLRVIIDLINVAIFILALVSTYKSLMEAKRERK